jgi:hypothetical protein
LRDQLQVRIKIEVQNSRTRHSLIVRRRIPTGRDDGIHRAQQVSWNRDLTVFNRDKDVVEADEKGNEQGPRGNRAEGEAGYGAGFGGGEREGGEGLGGQRGVGGGARDNEGCGEGEDLVDVKGNLKSTRHQEKLDLRKGGNVRRKLRSKGCLCSRQTEPSRHGVPQW